MRFIAMSIYWRSSLEARHILDSSANRARGKVVAFVGVSDVDTARRRKNGAAYGAASRRLLPGAQKVARVFYLFFIESRLLCAM